LFQGTASRAAEKVRFERFVMGHDFSRADKPFIFVIPSGLQSARDLLFRLFPQPVQEVEQNLSRRAATQGCDTVSLAPIGHILQGLKSLREN